MKPIIWIIDDEWENYDIEMKAIEEAFEDATVKISGMDYLKDLDEIGPSVDGIICQISVKVDADMISKLEKCKMISVYGVGYDKVDIVAAKAKGIAVANVPTYCTEDVSDYVIAAIYQCNKTLIPYSESVLVSPWGAMAAKKLIKRIGNSKLFIIGFGRIGQTVAQKAVAMGMEVLCYDPYISEDEAKEMSVKKIELEEGLGEADFVSLNMKLTPETNGFVDYEFLSKMKSSAYLINASRGGVINELDLIKAVKQKQIAGACLDVLVNEPPKLDDEILNIEDIIVTPHISYLTQSSLDELQLTAAQNVINCIQGKKVYSIVNA